ncbi:MAG: sulfatase-like hydrolase/transferase [Desulfuromusa sp.]|nr:sulfatase-like hydrolase/transferase [Desulfuromusa sp.]
MKKTLRFVLLGVLISLLIGSVGFASSLKMTKDAKNLEAYISHPKQLAAAKAKLAALEATTGKKPNVVILLVDDMGWGDPGVYGGGAAIGAPTPVMDRLAYNGLKLTSAYSQPTCTPTRASLLTGRLPIRHGLYRPPIFGEKGGISDEITLATLLSEAGYHTATFGKWHLGAAVDQQPQNKGFDESVVMYEGSPKFYVVTDYKEKLPEVYYDPELKAVFNHLKTLSPGVMKANKGEKAKLEIDINWDTIPDLDQKFADYSIDFINRMAKEDDPFFLYHSFTKVHEPSAPSKEFAGKSPAKQVFQDSLIEVDAIIERIIDSLKENNLEENTLVLLISDNGPEEDQFPDMGHTPFRGAKGSTWDGGVRVPAILSWPGMIEPMRTSDGLFDFTDIFNTVLSLAGAEDKMPTDRYIDGVDQTSFLLNTDGVSNRGAIFMYTLKDLTAVRWREWKKHLMVAVIGDGNYAAGIGMKNDVKLVRTPGLNIMNLYIDNKERISIGQQKAWTTPFFGKMIKAHRQSLKAYPPRKAIVTMP